MQNAFEIKGIRIGDGKPVICVPVVAPERETIIELICNEQIKHMIAKNEYESDRYNALEQLKAKIRIV